VSNASVKECSFIAEGLHTHVGWIAALMIDESPNAQQDFRTSIFFI